MAKSGFYTDAQHQVAPVVPEKKHVPSKPTTDPGFTLGALIGKTTRQSGAAVISKKPGPNKAVVK